MTIPNKPAPAPLTQEELQAASEQIMAEHPLDDTFAHADPIIRQERAYRLRAEAERDAAQAELKSLSAWKESAITLLPLQEWGHALGLPLGSDIHSHILPALRDLATHKAALRNPELMKSLLMTALSGMPSGGGSGPRIHKRQISKMLIEAGRWLTEAQSQAAAKAVHEEMPK